LRFNHEGFCDELYAYSPLLSETLDTVGEVPEQASVHLDRAYDSNVSRELLESRGLIGAISEKGKPAPLKAGMRSVVERTNSWHNAHKKLLLCTERRGEVIAFWIAFSNVIIVVRRLVRKAWKMPPSRHIRLTEEEDFRLREIEQNPYLKPKVRLRAQV
jgi:transposase